MFFFMSLYARTVALCFYFQNSSLQYHTLQEGMEHLLNGRHSVIANQYKAIIEVRSRYTLESGYTPVHISHTVYPVFAGVAWGFR